MIVVFDSNYLVLLLGGANPKFPIKNPDTDEVVERVQEKVDHLLTTLRIKKAKILIPTPVLAEIFTRFGADTSRIFDALSNTYGIEFADFNTAAAIETGMALHATKYGKKAKHESRTPWQKVKFDRQIVSIAKVNNAETVYSNDKQVRNWSRKLGMSAVAVWELENPPSSQISLEYPEDDAPAEDTEIAYEPENDDKSESR